MEWGQPQNFVWLWVLPAAIGVFAVAAWRKKNQMRRFGDLPLVERLMVSLSREKRRIKQGLILAASVLLVLSLAQPHFRAREITVERRGIDIMILLDVSNSMLATDIAPSRLEKAKLELSTLIDRLRQHRIGIVAFAGEAFIQCPLTLDKSAVKLFLSTVNPNLIPTPGTALGSAIRVANQAFTGKEKEYKAMILLTDGEDHGSRPLEEAKTAAKDGVRIFTIGIGTQDGSTVPEGISRAGFKKDRQGQIVLSKLDEKTLRQIARETDGAYYRSSRGEVEIEHLAREIDQMSQKGLKSEKSIEYDENYQYFLLPALLVLMLEMAVGERRK